ncbi:MAG: glutathione S-transferase family protein [Polyangiaceae bacterium]
MTIDFYTNPMSRGRIIHWMLEELGQPYETHWIAYGAHKAPDYLAVNPMGKFPTLVHDGKVVTECAAICMYLADVFPAAGLAPTPEEKADYYRWILFAAGPVEQAVTAKSMGWIAPKEKEGTLGFGNYENTIAALDAMLRDREYVCGKRFTAADVYVGSHVGWGIQFGTIAKTPAFEAYFDRLKERDAYKRQVTLNDAKMAEMRPPAAAT